MLSAPVAKVLTQSNRMTILDGELGDTATMNLPDDDLQMLKQKVHILIHAASSIALNNSLRELDYTVIAPTVCLAQYALKFVNLERFVFLSTAYVNAHLWMASKTSDVAVEERVYPLGSNDENPLETAPHVYRELQKTGTTEEYETHDFPWPYAYAKHLAERLVFNKAALKDASDKFLIIRPSVVGPADQFPYHGFTTSYSSPSTACAAAYAMHPGRKINLATRCENPDKEATIDEVPVDVVAERLLVHVALGSSGCVHAVSGEKGRLRIEDWWDAFKKERRWPWNVKPVWISKDWHSSDLHHVAKSLKIIGTSFAFSEEKTDLLAEKLNSDLKLYADRSSPYSLVHRRHHIHHLARQMAKKSRLPACSANILLRKGKPHTFSLSEK
jgi:nucleoside-diphosphate-sugar epimerase